MKQIFALMLVAGMAVATSCGNKATEDAVVEPEQTEQLEETPTTEEVQIQEEVLSTDSDTIG
ncbi:MULTISPECIES: hypothetical protein [Belliella]|uniref:Uncharacterized protein n=2 Tax=Belliella TaxID=232244 RepID=A0A239AJN8_9BACT|nr:MULTISPECIES: hypothetical protein [Belliella]SIT02711.1 hypothetical protein SAMN05421761_11236 [Belliella pelovolcani]SNR95740.1 hypothetical protein SAMN06295967_101203 [Belliella buryatensis]